MLRTNILSLIAIPNAFIRTGMMYPHLSVRYISLQYGPLSSWPLVCITSKCDPNAILRIGGSQRLPVIPNAIPRIGIMYMHHSVRYMSLQ